MKIINRAFIFTAALLFAFFISIHSDAGAAVTIQKISESALDELINTRNNKIAVTFMAAWCGPCIDELPVLNKLYQKYKTQGLNLIGISIDLEGPHAMQPIIDELKIGFPVYWYGASAVQRFSIYAIPMIYLVKNGQIVKELPGRRPGRELDKIIRKFLAD
jgi:thioredoxin-like negative regulator of GroEL